MRDLSFAILVCAPLMLGGCGRVEVPVVAAIPECTPAESAVAPPAAFEVERNLGHRAFDAGRRIAALHHYERALRLDSRAADFQMIDNLVDCYGSRTAQPEAAALIAHFKLHQAERSLARLSRASAHGARWGAIYTREKLTHVARTDYVHALALDLASSDCALRRRSLAALEKLHADKTLRWAHAEERTLVWQRSCPSGAPLATAKKSRTSL